MHARHRSALLLLAVGAALGTPGCGYNSLVAADEQVKAAWANVENVYQRRADLIPNLVATVKGSARTRRRCSTEVTAARASATQVKVSVDDLDDPEKLQAVRGGAGQALRRRWAGCSRCRENYPDLKANAAFRDLQAQLEGTENRIAVERERYNEAVRDYNGSARSSRP